jgi:tetratricopeptide (TPR) repeat protein
MKYLIILLLLLFVFCNLKAQYHLLYFSNDSIPKLKFDADYLQLQEKYEESSKIYRKLITVDSLRAYVYFNIAINHRYLMKIDSSLIYLNKALISGYDSLTVYKKIVSIYRSELNDKKRAYDLLTEMIGYWPKEAKLYVERASYVAYSDTEAYLNEMKKAAELGDKFAKHVVENFYKDKATLEKNLKTKGLK